jgi:hypothetical protein
VNCAVGGEGTPTQNGVAVPKVPMLPVQSPSLMHGVPQAARHVAQLCTQEKPQSQLPADVQVWLKVAQRPLLPPEPVLVPDGVKTHPGIAEHVACVAPRQPPSGVPTQFDVQKHPTVVAHDCTEKADAHVCPIAIGVPVQDPWSLQPAVLLHVSPPSAPHASGVPEQVPGPPLVSTGKPPAG